MNTKLLFLLLLLLTAAAVVLILPNDEKKISNNLTSLAEYTSSSPEESAITRLKKAAFAAKLCSNPCLVHIDSLTIDREFETKKLTDHILMMKKMLSDTHFSFHDTGISFPENDRAEIIATLRLKGKIDDTRFTDAYELSINAKKIKRDWLFSSFTLVEFMEQ